MTAAAAPTIGRNSVGSLTVLHIISSDAFAGLERHALQLAVELRNLGCAASIACPPSATVLRSQARAEEIATFPSASASQKTWLAGVACGRHVERPAVVHVHDGRAAIAGSVLARRAKACLVRSQHFVRPASVERGGWRGSSSQALHRALNRQVDGYVGVSQAVADAARSRGETATALMAIIPPGVRLPSEGAVADARIARQQASSPVVASLGRLEPERRFDVLLDAIPKVLAAVPHCRFVIAGSGRAEPDLKSQARDLGLINAIDWTGWVPESDRVLNQSHVYVNTWPWEGFGMATAEAMGFGLPVVAVNSGASVELVEPGVTGSLTPGGDPDALAAAIIDLITDLPHAERMGDAARERALDLYGTRRTAEAMLAFYTSLRSPTRR